MENQKINIKSKLKNISIFIIYIISYAINTQAQATEPPKPSKFSLNFYGEIYYSFDPTNPDSHEKPNFIFNHKRNNELNLNLALLKANYSADKWRATVGLMAGNYAQYNLASEPTWAQFIYEAHLGLRLLKASNLWLEVGILPSHIGFESAISSDCWLVTKSMSGENSPFYETGLRLNYTNKKDNLNMTFTLMNGWQKISRPEGQKTPSAGFQINYKANPRLTLNYSNFLGSDKPDSLDAVRVFNDVFVQYEITDKWGITAGFDIGRDKYDKNNYAWWFTPTLVGRYIISPKHRVALRAEYYCDKKQIMISTGTPNGFNTLGLSANWDFFILPNIELRMEGKIFKSQDPIFENYTTNSYTSLTAALTVKL